MAKRLVHRVNSNVALASSAFVMVLGLVDAPRLPLALAASLALFFVWLRRKADVSAGALCLVATLCTFLLASTSRGIGLVASGIAFATTFFLSIALIASQDDDDDDAAPPSNVAASATAVFNV